MASSTAFPSGGTYFDTAKRSFTAVAINESQDRAIATTEFLEAAETVTGLFDVLGSVAFSPVKKDMTGNIKVSNPSRSPPPGNKHEEEKAKVRD